MLFSSACKCHYKLTHTHTHTHKHAQRRHLLQGPRHKTTLSSDLHLQYERLNSSELYPSRSLRSQDAISRAGAVPCALDVVRLCVLISDACLSSLVVSFRCRLRFVFASVRHRNF
ncbi:hypothetical protein EVAR_2377_1 [Eumeta japonica]|uniref:Uncharacterized protein n=1 Tax=Eumeta variegata TaxID=151549 RepID=A0A4C1SGW1_EUMVA|nr:hypothetical protein EVAR_2377_1 [Eumeta japonica]